MMQRLMMGVVVAAAVVVGLGARGSAQPLGAFALTGVPTQGGTAEFVLTCSGLPQQGGATIGCFVELVCETASAVELQETAPASTSTVGNLPVVFAIPVTMPYQALSCEAYLFYDGYNNPRRRKTNTLAALFFGVS